MPILTPARLVRRATIVLAFTVSVLAGTAYLGWSGGKAERSESQWVERTHDVLDNLAGLRSAVTASQGNLNAYLVTLDTGALATYRWNEGDAQARLVRIATLARSVDGSAAGIERATRDLGLLQVAREQILMARGASLESARDAFTTTGVVARRQALMNVIDSLARTERGRLVQRADARANASTMRYAALIVALLTAIGIGVWAAAATRREVRAIQTLSDRHRALADQNPDGILVRVGERVVYANTAAATLLGYEAGADLIGRAVVELLHPDEHPAALERYRSRDPAALTKPPSRRRLLRADGTVIMVEIRAAQITFDGAAASEMVLRDLTARLAVEEAYAESEARYRALLDAMAEGVVLQNTAQEMLLWNPAAEQILGLTGEQLAGRSSFDPRWRIIDEAGNALTGEDHPSSIALRTGARATRVMGVERPSGEVVWIQATSMPLSHGDATAHYAVETTFADITVAKLAGERLADSERRYRLLADHSADLITRRSVDHVLEYVSPSHEAVLGWTPGEMVGRPATDFMVPETASHLASLVAGTDEAPILGPIRHRAGHVVWLEATSAPIHDAEGVLIGYQVAARDVTERLALEEQLRQAQKMDALGRMASGVAHDFNNLLTVIRGSSELLNERLVSDRESRGILDDIALAADRASALTAQLLTFARRQHTSAEQVSIIGVLRRTYPLLSRLAGPEVAVELTCSAAGTVAMVEAEAAQVEQVIYNLVVNARDAMPSGGSVRIECDTVVTDTAQTFRHGALGAGRYATIRVSDSGTGMTDEVLAKLFDPFYTTKPQGRGTGLGLATVLGIVQKAHGAVVVDSAVNAGATFTIYWPQVEPLRPTVSAPQPAALTSPSERNGDADAAPPDAARPRATARAVRLLVVDDEHLVQKVVASVLRQAGFDVVVADGGDAALTLLRKQGHGVKAVITDVRMPEMSGIELVETMQTERIALPVLFMSGQLDVALPSEWPTTLPRLFLSKPFAASELALKVQQLMATERSTAA